MAAQLRARNGFGGVGQSGAGSGWRRYPCRCPTRPRSAPERLRLAYCRVAGAGAASAGCRRSARGLVFNFAGRRLSACCRIAQQWPGSQGLPTNSTAPSVRAWRALSSSFCPERTMIFMSGDKASRSPISANPSSGRCGKGGRPRVNQCRLRRLAQLRSRPGVRAGVAGDDIEIAARRRKPSASLISGSSSTMSSKGFSARSKGVTYSDEISRNYSLGPFLGMARVILIKSPSFLGKHFVRRHSGRYPGPALQL
jgi:hypothetical protein